MTAQVSVGDGAQRPVSCETAAPAPGRSWFGSSGAPAALVEIPMSQARLGAISEGLHSVIVAKRLTHPDHEMLNRHVADAVAKVTGRGWRLAKSTDSAQIDALIALAIAVSRAEAKPEPVRLLGWL